MLFFPHTNSNIRIDARLGIDLPARETHSWETSVLSFLSLVRSYQAGRIVIESIQNLRPRILFIIPGHESGALGLFPTVQQMLDSNRRRQPVYSCHGGNVVGSISGTGIGVDIARISLPTHLVTSPNALSDVRAVIIHEMTHALRQMAGQMSCAPYLYYQNEEEFYAVLIANIFASEVGLQLRDGYFPGIDPVFERLCTIVRDSRPDARQPGGTLSQRTGFTDLTDCLRQSGLPQPSKDDLTQFSMYFAERHATLIRELSNQTPLLYNQLQNLTSAPFNPIRDVLRIAINSVAP